jgi:hypothetical protein
MANSQNASAEPSSDELRRKILETELQTKQFELDDAQERNRLRAQQKVDRSRRNAMRQSELAAANSALANIQQQCRHRQGGVPHNVLKGDGKPCVVRTKMLDGYTYLLQCTRCRLKVFTPNPAHAEPKHEKHAQYLQDKQIYDRLWEMSQDSGLDEIVGPSFIFARNGVPFIPERV